MSRGGRTIADSVNFMSGDYALAVGGPEIEAPPGWRWHKLGDVARLESGHTPSRQHPEYWDGKIPWIGLGDAREHHGSRIRSTKQMVTQAGIDNSAARVLPKDTVCLSRTASIGYATVMDRPMATSQDFVNWVCGPEIEPEFLMHLFLAERDGLRRFSKGSTHSTIYFPEVQAFRVCAPPIDEQRRIVAKLDALRARSRRAKDALDAVPALLDRLRQSILAAAFRGDLTADWREQNPDVEPIDTVLARVIVPPSKTGRAATITEIEGDAALAVGMSERDPPQGWKWVPLTSVAKLESGHTPSRGRSDWWGGDVPWIAIPDAREHHGRVIADTATTTNADGLANSAARLLPAGTVCLSRTASVGYVTIMGRPMATSQDFANWVCSEAIVPEWLMYLFLAEANALIRFAHGAIHSTIYFPELKAFHVCLPPVAEQRAIVEAVKARLVSVARIRAATDDAEAAHGGVDAAILAAAFRGELLDRQSDPPSAVYEARP